MILMGSLDNGRSTYRLKLVLFAESLKLKKYTNSILTQTLNTFDFNNLTLYKQSNE